MVGTIQKNRVGIPASLKDVTNREINSTETYWEKNGKRIFISYVTKTSKGKKNVIVLSTVEPLLGTTIDHDKCKPSIIKFYDFTKEGTGIIDQNMGYYTVKTKSRRWIMVAFEYLLDTIRVNASTVLAVNKLNSKMKEKKLIRKRRNLLTLGSN